MIGHEKIIKDLKSLADKGGLSHGYIFFGPAMVGKKMAARAIAGYLEGRDSLSMDPRLASFAEVATKAEREDDGILSDMLMVKASESGSIGIDAVREIKNFLWQKPNASSRRTLIIDNADLLTTEAQNALLKITEEPPASSLIILVTSDIESILPTILSRLEKIYFGLVPEKEIVAWLKDEQKLSQAKAAALAKQAFGKPGLAFRLLTDEDFQKNIELAEKFLKSPKTTRRDLIKKIIDPDEFDLRRFLDAVIIVLARDGAAKNHAPLWHKALALYERQTNFSLNPRLQLEALLL